jgi:flagellin-like protein
MKKIWKNEEGVSPVIAVILMVAITVVLAAVLYVMVSGMIGGGGTTPRVSMEWGEQAQAGNFTGSILDVSGGDAPSLDDVSVTIIHAGASGTKTLDLIASGSLVVGSLTMTFSDNGDGKIGGQDTFFITGGTTGDTVRLVYEPTEGRMYSGVLP